MISLTINGIQTKVSKGSTVLETAQKLEIEIPTLCHDPRIKPFGACRLCIVEIEGVGRPVTACTTPVEVGLVVCT
jgi:NADH dehydrogenase/NADH:ubiquinone oxidoreductase subunit G